MLQTDLSVPKDVSSLRVEVVTSGRVQFAQTYLIGAAPLLEMPAALSIVAGENPADPVSIRVLARQVTKGADGDQGLPRVLREIITTVPPHRTAMLPITLHWLCADDKSVTVSSAGEVSSSCGEGLTCIAGSCAPSEIDSSTLPDFDQAVVEGTDGAGRCFDVLACMASARVALLDIPTCSVQAPTGDPATWNVALRLPAGGSGTCDATHCFVPLDAGGSGWSVAGGTIKLPAAVCESAPATEVVVSSGCASKSELTPVCGPASLFDTPSAGTPVVPPDDGTMMPPIGNGSVPEMVLLQGVKGPRHVVVEPQGVFFLAQEPTGADALFWCALAGCESKAQVQWQAGPGRLAASFAHNKDRLITWSWQPQTMELDGCPFPGGCGASPSSVIASADASTPPMPVQGMLAVSDKAVFFREVEPSARIQTCRMLDTGCGVASTTAITDGAPVLALAISELTMAWTNMAGDLQFCDFDACELTRKVALTGQMFTAGPVLLGRTVLWGSDRAVRSCQLDNCITTQHDLFMSANPVTGLAMDAQNAYFGFLRTLQPPVHDLVKVPLDASAFGNTVRSGAGTIGGLGVDGDFVYSFVVDPGTGVGDLIRTSKTAMAMAPVPMP